MDESSKGRDPATIAAPWSGVARPNASIAVMSQVYARVAQLLGLGAAHATDPGYRLFWSTGGELEFVDLVAGEGSYAVVGRHSRCDVRLEEDEAISLRHLLLRALWIDGAVVLRVLDLRGSLPFFLDDDTPHRSILASGPVALRLGRYVVCAVPLGSGALDLAPNRRVAQAAGPERVAHAASSPSSLPSYRVGTLDELSIPPLESGERPAQSTRLTLQRGVTSVEDLVAPSAPGSARLVASGAGRVVTVELSKEDLAEGVLVGRSERCVDRGISRVLSNQISRAHVLLVETGGRVEAFDLCSTNGTWRGRDRVRRLALPDDGVTLRLGTAVSIDYQRRTEA